MQFINFICINEVFNVYGPRSRTSGAYGAVFSVFLAQKPNKPLTIVGSGKQTKISFIFLTLLRHCIKQLFLK